MFGFRFFVVMTGSMEPQYNIGDLIISKAVEKENIRVGDVITYAIDDKNTITHRVIDEKLEEGKNLYKTKGDNNNSSDPNLVEYNQILGKVIFNFHKIGSFFVEFFSGVGIIFTFVIVFILYIHSNRSEEKRIAREYARKKYNLPKYEKGQTYDKC